MLAHRPLVVAHMCDLFPLVHLPTGVGPLSIWTLNIIKKNVKPHSLLCLGTIFRYTLNNLTSNPKNRALVQMLFLFNWGDCLIPNVNFQGVLNAEKEAPDSFRKNPYGLFTYMKTIKINHSWIGKYTGPVPWIRHGIAPKLRKSSAIYWPNHHLAVASLEWIPLNQQFSGPASGNLLVGWTKPFEKYARQIGHLTPSRGKTRTVWNHNLVIVI